MGQDTLLHAHNEDHVEFQPLGRVQREQRGCVRSLGQIIHLGNQSNFFQERSQGSLLWQGIVVGGHGAQLHQVGPAIFPLLGAIPNPAFVRRLLQHLIQDLRHGQVSPRLSPTLQRLEENQQLLPRPRAKGDSRCSLPAGAGSPPRILVSLPSFLPMLFPQHQQRLMLRHSHPICPLRQRCRRPSADAPPGDVDDAPQAHAVVRIVNQPQVSQSVPDLPPGVEAGSAHQLVGHVAEDESILQRPRLSVGAIHHGAPTERRPPLGRQPGDLVDDVAGLLALVVGFKDGQQRPGPLVRVQPLGRAPRADSDDGVGGVEDGLRGAVVAFQQEEFVLGEILTKTPDVAVVGASETVDRLIFISYYAEVAPFAGQHLDQPVLGRVGVLELVHHQEQVAALVLLQDPGLLLEQQDHAQQEVAEIESVVGLQQRLVAFVDAASHLFRMRLGLDRLGSE